MTNPFCVCLLLFATAYISGGVLLVLARDGDPIPLNIKGLNNFTGESITAVQESQSLQLTCVVRNTSFEDITWTKDGVPMTRNGTLLLPWASNSRYAVNVERNEQGRRFFRLEIRNISHNDGGSFGCISEYPYINDTVNIAVKIHPATVYPMCNMTHVTPETGENSGNISVTGPVVMQCSTEIGYPEHHVVWYYNGTEKTPSGQETTENELGISTTKLILETLSPGDYYECRLFQKRQEVHGRACCIPLGDSNCQQQHVSLGPTSPAWHTTVGHYAADMNQSTGYKTTGISLDESPIESRNSSSDSQQSLFDGSPSSHRYNITPASRYDHEEFAVDTGIGTTAFVYPKNDGKVPSDQPSGTSGHPDTQTPEQSGTLVYPFVSILEATTDTTLDEPSATLDKSVSETPSENLANYTSSSITTISISDRSVQTIFPYGLDNDTNGGNLHTRIPGKIELDYERSNSPGIQKCHTVLHAMTVIILACLFN